MAPWPCPKTSRRSAAKIAEVLHLGVGAAGDQNADERKAAPLRKDKDGKAVYLSDEFKALWDRIKHQTTYRVRFDNAKMLQACIAGLQKAPAISKARLQWRKADTRYWQGRCASRQKAPPQWCWTSRTSSCRTCGRLWDPHQLTRRSIITILTKSGRLDDFKRNPQLAVH